MGLKAEIWLAGSLGGLVKEDIVVKALQRVLCERARLPLR